MSNKSCDRSLGLYVLGKYLLSLPLKFSLDPLCQGECGSQKYVGSCRFLQDANSVPRSKVMIFLYLGGSFR